MTDKAAQLISDFKTSGWQTTNLYERLFNLASNSNDAFAFASKFLYTFDKNTTIFNDILSYIDQPQFDELITIAVEILTKQKNENAESVIEYASLQFPELLHQHLRLIFELKPNEYTYFEAYPWRNLAMDVIPIFKNLFISAETSITDKQALFERLLETRNLEIIIFAHDYALKNKLFDEDDLEDYLLAYLELVGFTKRQGRIEPYCPNVLRHFSFPKNYFVNDRPSHLNKQQHPTWNLKADENTYKFGGVIDHHANNPFMHLITFDQIPDGLQISDLSTLTLGMHIRELNEYGAVFYQHDKNGQPSKIGELKNIEIYSDLPIQETFVSFSASPDRWFYQSWGSANSRENLFRLGGEPSWIQSAEVLICPISGEKMDFLMQLDTDLPNTENGELYFGSGGICYVFWCDKTKVSGYIMQCT